MPSGREYHSPKPWVPPVLEAQTLASMRAPPDTETKNYRPQSDDSDDEEDEGAGGPRGAGQPVGAFPGTSSNYY